MVKAQVVPQLMQERGGREVRGVVEGHPGPGLIHALGRIGATWCPGRHDEDLMLVLAYVDTQLR